LLKVRFSPEILEKLATQNEVEAGGPAEDLWSDIPWLKQADLSIGEEVESLYFQGEEEESEASHLDSKSD